MTENDFLQAILTQPEDDTARLVFADWLEEQGDPRAEFVRLQVQLARLPRSDRDKATDFEGRGALESALRWWSLHHEADWRARLPEGVDWTFRRGLPEHATVWNFKTFRQRAEDLFEGTPLLSVRFRSLHGCKMLARSPHLERLRELDVSINAIKDQGVEALAQSPHLKHLTRLDLRNCQIGPAGVEALSRAPSFSQLCELNLSNNAIGLQGIRALAQSPHLQRLQRLDLGSCGLGDDELTSLSQSPILDTVEELRLSRNPIAGKGLEALLTSQHVGQLTRLWVDSCEVRSLDPESCRKARQLNNLRTLVLRFNSMGADLGTALLAAPFTPQLRELDLCHTDLSINSLASLAQARWDSLEHLVLYGNRLAWDWMEALLPMQAPQLRSLDIAANRPNREGIESLVRWPAMQHLTSLKLDESHLHADAMQVLGQSPAVRGLRKLSTWINYIGTEGARAIARSPHFANLRELEISSNRINDEGIQALASSPHLNHLKILRLGWNDHTTAGIEALFQTTNLPSLTRLDLSGREVTEGTFEAILRGPLLGRLEELHFGATGCTDSEVEPLLGYAQRYPRLWLHLSSGQLSEEMKGQLQVQWGGRLTLGY